MPNLNHPTVLARRSSFERIGLFDLRYRCAMDYDWFLRLHQAGGRGLYVPGLRANMTHDGVNLRFGSRCARLPPSLSSTAATRARLEMYGRIAKTAAGRVVKRRATPVYRMIRRVLNRSYEPLDDP